MSKRKFPVEDIRELEYMGEDDKYTLVDKTFSHNSRWSIWHKIVFIHEARLWQVLWPEPATEMQESELWEDEIEAVEVKPYTETVTKYRPVV